MRPPIAGLTRVRNESVIIQSTLDWYARYCDAGIYVFDEASDDDTVDLCYYNYRVQAVVRVNHFETNPQERRRFEGWPRQTLLDLARAQINDPDLWVIYFDADERLEWDVDAFDFEAYDAASFRLWDAYITLEDEFRYLGAAWPELQDLRRWFGPEFRDIPMVFKANAITRFDNRSPSLINGARVHPYAGDVRHFGKAISVEEFEHTIDYYTQFQPKNFGLKWEVRRGKAVHVPGDDGVMRSDFGGELIEWKDREELGYPLVDNSLD